MQRVLHGEGCSGSSYVRPPCLFPPHPPQQLYVPASHAQLASTTSACNYTQAQLFKLQLRSGTADEVLPVCHTLTSQQQEAQYQKACVIPGRAGLPGGWKESMTSQSHSTRAALVLVPGPSGPSAWVGQMRCRSSRINREGKQSRASCTCIHTHR